MTVACTAVQLELVNVACTAVQLVTVACTAVQQVTVACTAVQLQQIFFRKFLNFGEVCHCNTDISAILNVFWLIFFTEHNLQSVQDALLRII